MKSVGVREVVGVIEVVETDVAAAAAAAVAAAETIAGIMLNQQKKHERSQIYCCNKVAPEKYLFLICICYCSFIPYFFVKSSD